MGKAGPKSNAPGGYGTITPKGYRRIYHKGRMCMEHRVVWELHNGEIPEGLQIHHRDENKLNNDISNLELVNPTEHKRIHSNATERIDGWYKVCGKCGQEKHEGDYYISKEGWLKSECKSCTVERNMEYKRRRRN